MSTRTELAAAAKQGQALTDLLAQAIASLDAAKAALLNLKILRAEWEKTTTPDDVADVDAAIATVSERIKAVSVDVDAVVALSAKPTG